MVIISFNVCCWSLVLLPPPPEWIYFYLYMYSAIFFHYHYHFIPKRTYHYSYVSTIFFLATFFTGTHVRLSVRAFTFLFLFRSCYFIWEHTYELLYVCSIKFFNIRSVV